MAKFGNYTGIQIDIQDHVATLEVCRPPHNFLEIGLMEQIASAYEALDKERDCRAIVLCAQGKNFCAGNDFSRPDADVTNTSAAKYPLYAIGARLFATSKPSVAAVQGAAIGGGLGLALAADFRVAAPSTRVSANFVLLGLHQGFGITFTLPRVVGQQQALRMLYTGRRYTGTEGYKMGLFDELVPEEQLRQRAWDLAREIAIAAPLAVQSVRATMRRGIFDEYVRTTDHESAEQMRLRATADFKEGVLSVSERRMGRFRAQ